MKLQKFDLNHKPCYWWIRSANSNFNHIVCIVSYLGITCDCVAYNNAGVLTACIII